MTNPESFRNIEINVCPECGDTRGEGPESCRICSRERLKQKSANAIKLRNEQESANEAGRKAFEALGARLASESVEEKRKKKVEADRKWRNMSPQERDEAVKRGTQRKK